MRILAIIFLLGLFVAVATPQKAIAQSDTAAPADMVELEFWRSVKDSADPAELQAYLAAYPDGTFAALASIRMSKLQTAQGAETAEAAETEAREPEGPAYPDDKGWLGVEIVDLNKDTADALGRDDLKGRLVLSLVENSPSAGKLQRGDLIVEAAQQPVNRGADLIGIVSNTPPGTSALLRIVRDGEEQFVAVTLGGYAEILMQAVEAGDVASQVQAAHALRIGRGVTADPEAAFAMYRDAWDAGDQEAGFWLARSYTEGWGVDADTETGAALMRDLADAGHVEAKAQTAFNILAGNGAETNPVKALVYADEAAEAGNAFGQYLMGFISEGVEGLPGSDAEMAIEHYRKAAIGNISGALQNLERLGQPILPVAEQQERLATLGVYRGKVDGVAGKGTRGAIRLFERMIGAEETGQMTPRLARRLHQATTGRNRLDMPNENSGD